jgi:hypothetical protein
MEKITGPEFGGVVAGGEAAGGAYVWLTIRLGDQNQTMIIEKSRVAVLMTGLATAAGMARDARVKNDPNEANDTGMDAVYALEVSDAGVGRHTDQGKALLDVRIDAQKGRQMNLFLSAGPAGLIRLRAACTRALLQMRNKAKAKSAAELN